MNRGGKVHTNVRGAALVRLGLLALLAAAPSASAETRFAILVGHNIGDLHETPLRWAESDATRMLDVLTELGNIRDDRAELVLSPTRAELDRALVRMEGRVAEARDRGERTLLVFYFSGHADKEELHLASEKIRLSEIEVGLKAGPANTVVTIIDACQNDRNPRTKQKGATRAPAFRWPSPSVDAPTGYVRITSAAEGEVAQESDDLEGSLFTHHLLSGMRGTADNNGDGTVSLAELYRYGYSRTLEDTHRVATAVQHSEIDVATSGRGEVILTYPRRARSAIHLAAELEGHLLVIDDASGRITAEARLAGGTPIRLAVAPGKYRLQLRKQTDVFSGLVAVGTSEREVRAQDLSRRPVLAVLEKGARYDPHPYVFVAGSAVSSSHIDGFSTALGARLGFGYRFQELFLGVLTMDMGYANASNAQWRYRQFELSVMGGVDWVRPFASYFAMSIGLRGGGTIIRQEGDREEAERLRLAGVPPEALIASTFGLGPKAAVVAGFEVHPWSQLGLRFAFEPSAWWIRTEAGESLGAGWLLSLAMMVRL